jgi:hypothetical protein
MTQNILEDYRAALKFRQPQKRLKADRDDVCLGYGRRFDVFGERNGRVPGPVAQEIEARVVGDAKQPALEIIYPGALGSRVKGYLARPVAFDSQVDGARPAPGLHEGPAEC